LAPSDTSPRPVLPPLREVIARHGIGARKGLGQHFLLDGNLTDRIARAAGSLDGIHVVEIGPGPGGLTRSLLAAGAARVVAVERDPRCVDALAELEAAYPDRLKIVTADALEVDAAGLVPAPRRIVANLPYNVSTALLRRWLDAPGAFESMTLMFQTEVAERLAATPGGRDYGRLSVLTQWLCDVRILFNVARTAFVPPPKVSSSVVRLFPRSAPLSPARMATLERITAAAFGQRRKMLRSSLKTLEADTETLLKAAGIDDGTRRAETLSIEEFCALARALDES
jgi:16S rRNA (adenine1518-N6/adenine1519-N6)-dimethyltransferase